MPTKKKTDEKKGARKGGHKTRGGANGGAGGRKGGGASTYHKSCMGATRREELDLTACLSQKWK